MTLGNILRRAQGTAITGRSVTFRVIARDSQNQVTMVEVAGLLHPVCAADALEAHRQALAHADKHGGSDASPHELTLYEAAYFLAKALRQPDNPLSALILDAEVGEFIRSASIGEFARLRNEHEAYMADEYGVSPSPSSERASREEALNFSSPGRG